MKTLLKNYNLTDDIYTKVSEYGYVEIPYTEYLEGGRTRIGTEDFSFTRFLKTFNNHIKGVQIKQDGKWITVATLSARSNKKNKAIARLMFPHQKVRLV